MERNKLSYLVKREVRDHGKYPTLKRVRAGKFIMVWAIIPLNLSFWMLPIGAFMATGIKPTVWATGKLNKRKGNGDLQW